MYNVHYTCTCTVCCIHVQSTVKPVYSGHLGTQKTVLIIHVDHISECPQLHFLHCFIYLHKKLVFNIDTLHVQFPTYMYMYTQ